MKLYLLGNKTHFRGGTTVEPAKREADRLPPIRFDYLPHIDQGALGIYTAVTHINNNANDHNISQ